MNEQQPYTDEQIKAAILLDGLAESSGGNGSLRGLRRQMLALTIAVLVAIVAMVALILVVASNGTDASRGRAVAECRNAFTTKVAAAESAKSDALGDVVLELGRIIVETAAVHPPAPFDLSAVLPFIAKRDQVAKDYNAAVTEATKWATDGNPLPCPIPAGR